MPAEWLEIRKLTPCCGDLKSEKMTCKRDTAGPHWWRQPKYSEPDLPQNQCFLLLEDHFAASAIPPTYPLPKHTDTICLLDLCQITFNLTQHWCIKLPVVNLYTGTSFWQVLLFLYLCTMCHTHPCQVLAVKSWILRTTYRCSCLTLRFAFCLPNKSQSHSVF